MTGLKQVHPRRSTYVPSHWFSGRVRECDHPACLLRRWRRQRAHRPVRPPGRDPGQRRHPAVCSDRRHRSHSGLELRHRPGGGLRASAVYERVPWAGHCAHRERGGDWSNTLIVTTVPAGAATGNLVVKTSGGTSTAVVFTIAAKVAFSPSTILWTSTTALPVG